jgi:hypothetical protein
MKSVVANSLHFYLNHESSITGPEYHRLDWSAAARKEHLIARLGKTLPDCIVRQMLEATSDLQPNDMSCLNETSSLFGSWRGKCEGIGEQKTKWANTNMRSVMNESVTELKWEPLWLIMSIAVTFGAFNPMMGYNFMAGWWHQVPPGFEAYIIWLLRNCLLSRETNKQSYTKDTRPGNAYYILTILHVITNINYVAYTQKGEKMRISSLFFCGNWN